MKNNNHHNKDGHYRDGHSAAKPHAGAGHQGEGIERKLHNPIEDKLIPLEPLDLTKEAVAALDAGDTVKCEESEVD